MLDSHSNGSDSAASQGGKRILVIDDCDDSASALARLLEIYGHVVRIATDGVQALQTARGFHPDICLLDLTLPVMDGYEIARRLLAELAPDSPPMRLVAVSGHARSVERENNERIRFDAHLIKPVDFDALANVIAN